MSLQLSSLLHSHSLNYSAASHSTSLPLFQSLTPSSLSATVRKGAATAKSGRERWGDLDRAHWNLHNDRTKSSASGKSKPHLSRTTTTSASAPSSNSALSPSPGALSSSDPSFSALPSTVLVVGASGGVGQLCVASLLRKGIRVKAIVRNEEKAKRIFSISPSPSSTWSPALPEIVSVDLRNAGELERQRREGMFEGVKSVILCVGTTAFPSKRWDGDNGPEQTDFIGPRNLLSILPSSVSRIVMVSSVGVKRSDSFPFNILNLFGVLNWKGKAEELVREKGRKRSEGEGAGVEVTILRPGRLTDGPYTSYDLNTLLKATAGVRRAAQVRQGDTLSGETSRVLVAEACVQCLQLPVTFGKDFSIISVEEKEGVVPEEKPQLWERLFSKAV